MTYSHQEQGAWGKVLGQSSNVAYRDLIETE